MTPGDGTTLQVRATGLKWREVAGSIVVMDLEASRYVAVEGSIASVWPRLVAGATLGELSSDIAERYDVGIDEAHADLRAVAADLIERRVLIIVDASA